MGRSAGQSEGGDSRSLRGNGGNPPATSQLAAAQAAPRHLQRVAVADGELVGQRGRLVGLDPRRQGAPHADELRTRVGAGEAVRRRSSGGNRSFDGRRLAADRPECRTSSRSSALANNRVMASTQALPAGHSPGCTEPPAMVLGCRGRLTRHAGAGARFRRLRGGRGRRPKVSLGPMARISGACDSRHAACATPGHCSAASAQRTRRSGCQGAPPDPPRL